METKLINYIEKYLIESVRSVNNIRDNDRFVVMQESIVERDTHFLFHYQSEKYLQTGNLYYFLSGRRPFKISKLTGKIIRSGKATPFLDGDKRKSYDLEKAVAKKIISEEEMNFMTDIEVYFGKQFYPFSINKFDKSRGVTPINNITKFLLESGDGNTGIVFARPYSVFNRVPPLFNAINENGKVVYIDGQIGGYANILPYKDFFFMPLEPMKNRTSEVQNSATNNVKSYH